MSTFANISEIVKSAAQNVADRIHHSATISRVKILINKEDALLQKTLAALGTVCFEQHKNPETPTDFTLYFEQVEKSQARLVALQMKLHELYTQTKEEPTEEKPADAFPEEDIFPMSDENVPPSEGSEPPAEADDDVPPAGQLREEAIAQLVDVVSEEMGTEDYEAEISEELNQEIISRNSPD